MKNIYTVNDFLDINENDKVIFVSMKEDNYDKFIFPDWIEEITLDNYKYELDIFPKKLQRLCLSKYQYKLDNLPNSLIKLSLYDTDKSLNNLPLSLKELLIDIDESEFTHSFDYLNEGLETFTLRAINPINISLANLPYTLVNLRLWCAAGSNYDFNNLSDNIEDLIITCVNFNFDKLPNKLKKIKFTHVFNGYEDVIKKIKNIAPNVIIEIYLRPGEKTIIN